MSEQELIKIETLPQIEEYFTAVLPLVEARVIEMTSVLCTEDNRQDVKKTRAEIRQIKEQISKSIKSKKEELFASWYQVEAKAKEVTGVLDRADEKLKEQIAAVEDSLKAEKEEIIIDFFNELKEMNHLEWLEYERLGIKVGLSDSEKKLKESVQTKVETISTDVKTILSMENSAEIMAEYKNSLNLSSAISLVQFRKSQILQEEQSISETAKRIAEEKAHRESVQNALNLQEEENSIITPPKQIDSNNVPSRLLEMGFRVKGTLEQLKNLKKYIVDNEIEIL